MKIKKVCKYCNKDFYIYASRTGKGAGTYCSKKCFLEGTKRPTPVFERICKACKKHFWVTKAMDSGGKHIRKYCSRKCMGKGYAMGQNPHIFKGEKINKLCKNCKKIFSIKKYEVENKIGGGNFCSTSCRNIFYGQSKETRKKMSLNKLKLWQNKEYKENQIKVMLKGLIIRPTSLEQQMINIIKKNNLPYKYTGNGDFIIGGKNPDFININGEKKYIEVGNTYHHQGDYIKNRTEHLKRYGWEGYYFITNKLNEEEILSILKGNK